jgi:hypothetical protein
VTGDVRITGAAIAQGEGSVGVRVLGDVAGEFMIGSTVAATGFTSAPGFSTVATNYVDPDELKRDRRSRNAATRKTCWLAGWLEIRGDLARGFLKRQRRWRRGPDRRRQGRGSDHNETARRGAVRLGWQR